MENEKTKLSIARKLLNKGNEEGAKALGFTQAQIDALKHAAREIVNAL